ncbi:hypothetical protein DMH26_17640 [Streptomyces sp. WAC 05379]|uniref:hypothetical protein n=1 Tax=Streptomyces sp. WAC 05379 TaxID=2203207 RepID=UPI000F741375|nr:hypothetical protein [Streptomyces sp. WAC 05379]RSN99946.1 hypothetical protein DMH26_17640 [Streptomyces sp. WAC 05379]
MPDTSGVKGWGPSRTQKTIAVLLLLIVWTGVANSWTEKGCTLPQGYVYVVTHGGSPDRGQGCESEPDGPVYTDQYYG